MTTPPICVQCRAEKARRVTFHQSVLLPFCGESCSKIYCAIQTQLIGPKFTDDPPATKSHHEDERATSDLYITGLKREDGTRVPLVRYISIMEQDPLAPPSEKTWLVDARFDASPAHYKVPAGVYNDIESGAHAPRTNQTVAALRLRFDVSEPDYLLLDELINYLSGPSTPPADKQLFRGIAMRLLRGMIYYIRAHRPEMLPKGLKSRIGLSAGSIRNYKDAREDDQNQRRLVEYYRSVGFRKDDDVPINLADIDTVKPMSITVETLLNGAKNK